MASISTSIHLRVPSPNICLPQSHNPAFHSDRKRSITCLAYVYTSSASSRISSHIWETASLIMGCVREKALLLQATLLKIIQMRTVWQLPNSSSNTNKHHDSAPANYILISLTKADSPLHKAKFGAFCGKPKISLRCQQTKLNSRREWHNTFRTWGPNQDTCKINHK